MSEVGEWALAIFAIFSGFNFLIYMLHFRVVDKRLDKLEASQ